MAIHQAIDKLKIVFGEHKTSTGEYRGLKICI